MTDTSNVNSDLNFADQLWKAADALRGQVDAAEYKHVVLGLLFLKYISDSFETRRDQLHVQLLSYRITRKRTDTNCGKKSTKPVTMKDRLNA